VSVTTLKQTERQFQAAVVEYAEMMGWRVYHTFDSRRSASGFPDLVLVRERKLIFAELKADKGRVSQAQVEWLNDLAGVRTNTRGDGFGSGIEVELWRPSDWPEIAECLRR
jgi:hypothetical protein